LPWYLTHGAPLGNLQGTYNKKMMLASGYHSGSMHYEFMIMDAIRIPTTESLSYLIKPGTGQMLALDSCVIDFMSRVHMHTAREHHTNDIF
jgi:hypothetical protein